MTDSQRAQKIAAVWTRDPDLSEEEVHATVEADLQREAADRVEAEARSKESVDSFVALTSCACCRVETALGARDGLCHLCRPIIGLVRAERRATDMVGELSRRQLAEQLLERQEKGA